jgi:hypothetical protein
MTVHDIIYKSFQSATKMVNFKSPNLSLEEFGFEFAGIFSRA